MFGSQLIATNNKCGGASAGLKQHKPNKGDVSVCLSTETGGSKSRRGNNSASESKQKTSGNKSAPSSRAARKKIPAKTVSQRGGGKGTFSPGKEKEDGRKKPSSAAGKRQKSAKGGKRNGDVEMMKAVNDMVDQMASQSVAFDDERTSGELLIDFNAGKRLTERENAILTGALEREMKVASVVKKYEEFNSSRAFEGSSVDHRLSKEYNDNYVCDRQGLDKISVMEFDSVKLKPEERGVSYRRHLVFLSCLAVVCCVLGNFDTLPLICGVIYVGHTFWGTAKQQRGPVSFRLKAIVRRVDKGPMERDLRVESSKVTGAVLDTCYGTLEYQRKFPLWNHDVSDAKWTGNYKFAEIYDEHGLNVVCVGVKLDGRKFLFERFGFVTERGVISYEKFLQLIQGRNISPLRSDKENHDVIRQRAGAMPGINISRSDVAVHNIEENTILAAVLFSKHLKISREGNYLVDLLDSSHPLG